jgi:hypothetical protein
MKHEQLLVQYGMIRAGGLRALELEAELVAKRAALEQTQSQLNRLRERSAYDADLVRQHLRDAQLELEERRLTIDALEEKVRGLEMLTRNAQTSESIEQQFSAVMEQSRRVDALTTERRPGPAWVAPPADEPEH